ncbi:hypothetical protein BpHYR1_002249 [Brachionus plicatilis]|uniref:Uncharacterized protein n=1 Tax=Brachionus plicatilis TaxID=10195 RepID=A0A3M7RJV0_BRAPC|nr:hypothetical protein BpHYR1_002249 [Brachionus plicatilis]
MRTENNIRNLNFRICVLHLLLFRQKLNKIKITYQSECSEGSASSSLPHKEILQWFFRSQDIKLIKNLWSFMNAKLASTKITSIEHLKEALHNERMKTPTEFMKKYSIYVKKFIVAPLSSSSSSSKKNRGMK